MAKLTPEVIRATMLAVFLSPLGCGDKPMAAAVVTGLADTTKRQKRIRRDLYQRSGNNGNHEKRTKGPNWRRGGIIIGR